MEHSFSNRLFLVPLFQGFSRLDFLDLVAKTPFDFRTLSHGQTLVRQNDEAKALAIVLQGGISCETESPAHTYRFSETLPAPCLVQPERLFGLHNRYASTVRAEGEAQIALLDKQSVRRLLTEQPAFQINFYNTLCSLAQYTDSLLWQVRRTTPEDRFRAFLTLRCRRPAGPKELRILMTDLAQELGTSRLRVSQMLAGFAEKGKLTYSRGIIRIPSLEKL